MTGNSTLNFTEAQNHKLWFQAYCLKVPHTDTCQYGSCPNPDVTGMGQQVSLYVSSTILAIMLTYAPKSAKPAIYPYLVNVYALLTSALVSLIKVNLTRNDAVFVLVAVASPVTIYLWISALPLLVWKLPTRLVTGKTKFEQKILAISIIGSFALWMTMVGVIIKPPQIIAFSQPACNKSFSGGTWVTLIWEVPYFIQAFILAFALAVVVSLKRRGYLKANEIYDTDPTDPNLMQWTRDSLNQIWPSESKSGIIVNLLFITQMVLTIENLPLDSSNWNWLYVNSAIAGVALVRTVVDFFKRQRSHNYTLRQVLITTGTFITWAFIYALFLMPWDIINSGSLFLLIILGPVWWINAQKIYDNKFAVAFSRISYILSFVIILTPLISFIFIFLFSPPAIMEEDFNPEGFGINPFTPSLLQFSWWVIPWAVATLKQKHLSGPLKERTRVVWFGIFGSAPMMKLTFVIIVPSTLWVFACITSDPSNTSALSFGQLLPLFMLVLPLWSFLSLCWRNKFHIWNTIWLADVRPRYTSVPIRQMSLEPYRTNSLSVMLDLESASHNLEERHNIVTPSNQTATPSSAATLVGAVDTHEKQSPKSSKATSMPFNEEPKSEGNDYVVRNKSPTSASTLVSMENNDGSLEDSEEMNSRSSVTSNPMIEQPLTSIPFSDCNTVAVDPHTRSEELFNNNATVLKERDSIKTK